MSARFRRLLALALSCGALGVCAITPRAARAYTDTDTADSDDDNDDADADTTDDDDDAGADAVPETPPPPLDAVAREKLERDLSGLLADSKLGFCHDPEIAREEASGSACELALAHARQRCPALEKACSAKPPTPAEIKRETANEDESNSAPMLPSALGSVLFWGLILLFAVLLVRLLAPLFLKAESPPEPEAGTPDEPPPNEPRREHRPQESDVDRLLARADAERKQGRFEAAIATLHAALVHQLGQDQLITVEAARTNGDYLHELAPKPKLQGSVRQVFRLVERIQFGRSEPSDAACADLLSRILPLVKRGAVLLLLLALLPTGVTACSAGAQRTEERSPAGLYLLTQLLEKSGTQVRRRVGKSEKFAADVEKVLVLGEDLSPKVWASLLTWARDGGRVFVAQSGTHLQQELDVSLESAAPCGHPLVLGPPQDQEKLEVIGVSRRRLRVEHPEGRHVSVDASCDDKPYVLTVPVGAGSVTYLAGPELLGNASLSVGDNAAFVIGLLGAPGEKLELVDDWTGGGESSPLRALQNAGMRPLLLEILAFMAVLIWRYGSAFGTRRDPNAPARRAFVDHVRALGASYARARANRHALGLYSAFALEQLRERYGRGKPLGLIALADELARRTGRREQDVMRLLTEAHEATQNSELERGGPADLATLRELESLLNPSGGTP